VMRQAKKYSPEVRERAVRLVFEHEREYASQWAAIQSIAAKIGCSGETLRSWVRQAERDLGKRPGPTTAERERIKELEREVRERRRATGIVSKARAFFGQSALDRGRGWWWRSSSRAGRGRESSRSAACCRSLHRRTTPARPGSAIRRSARLGRGERRC